MTIAQSKLSFGIWGALVRSPTMVAPRVALDRHEDVDALNTGTEPRDVVRRRDLERAASTVSGVRADEAVDVDAVDRSSALEPPVRIDRRHASESAQARGAPVPPVDDRLSYGSQGATDRRRDEAPPPGGMVLLIARRQGGHHSAHVPIDIHPRLLTQARGRLARFDDGVLSIGAAIASWVRAGHRVGLLTVLGCDPESTAAAGGWDRRGGFATEGEAARARRAEDRRACETLRVSPMWLPYGSDDYERHGGQNDVWSAISPTVADADLVLVPGSPLSHPDTRGSTRCSPRVFLPTAWVGTPSSRTLSESEACRSLQYGRPCAIGS